MSINEHTPEIQAKVLMRLIGDDIRTKLIDKALAAIRPGIEAEVEQVMIELKPRIAVWVEEASMSTVVHLITKVNGKEVG